MKNWFQKRKDLKRQELEEGARKRQQIIEDAQAMKRLVGNEDFNRFCDILNAERDEINAFLIDENGGAMKDNDARTRLIARINQIDRVLRLPETLVWRMENLTEVRDALKEQQKAAKNPRGAGPR